MLNYLKKLMIFSLFLIVIFIFNSSVNEKYQLVATLQSPEPSMMAEFGWKVNMDGDTIVVSERKQGVHLFDYDGNLIRTIKPPSQGSRQFGYDIAINEKMVVIGDPYSRVDGKGEAGRTYIYDVNGNLKSILEPENPINDGFFGENIAIYKDIVICSEEDALVDEFISAGKVYIYDGDQLTSFTSPNPFHGEGFSKSISTNGEIVVVGVSPPHAGLFIYDFQGEFLFSVTPPDSMEFELFGNQADICGDLIITNADADVNGISKAGKVYLFDVEGNLLKHLQSPEPKENTFFGDQVKISESNIVVFEFKEGENDNEGTIYVFLTSLQSQKSDSNSKFGESFAVFGDTVVISEPHTEVDGVIKAGKVHIYKRRLGIW